MLKKNIFKIFFCGLLAFGLVATAFNVVAAPDTDGSIFPGGSCENCKDSNDKDGSIFPGGGCDRCLERRKSDAAVRIVDGTKKRSCPTCPTPEFRTKNYAFAQARYKNSDRACCDMAPFALTHVDFKLDNTSKVGPYSSHVGNYRFRIFGCRRESKKAMLNHGRVIQKDMAFQEVFRKAADKCFKVMEIPGDVCLSDPSIRLPEYVLTAEINNFFMNVCDEYDWDKAEKSNRRDGSAEMTVTWRLMNLSQSKVFWKGVTTGYAELEDGIYEGEVKLAEDAFADATARLSNLPGFEAQLKVRLSDQEMITERAALAAMDEQVNPGKCNFAKEIAYTHSCDYAPQPQCPAVRQPACPCAVQRPCICNQPVCNCPVINCPCAQPAKPKVEEFVDVKTEKKIIEKKIITTTRVETPEPVCQQVCQPVCMQPMCQVQCTRTCEQPKCRKICTKTCDSETGKCTTTCREDCGDKPVEPKVEVLTYVPKVEEKGEVVVDNTQVAPQIEETGGVDERHRSYENCIDELGNVITDGSCANIDDSWIDLEGYQVSSDLCIVDRPPYNELSPENMLKIRGSVVDVKNAVGKEGTGLIISDSFVLTSAGLVNKLKNTYDVKTINGEVLKARAVRFNPGKNIALLHLNTPTTYTPLSLNLELPAIDQEGFISLGQMAPNETAQSYMDDNGKIYGYRYSDTLGTEIIVDTLLRKVTPGSVLIDRLGTVNGISNAGRQTENGMDLFIPTETALRSVGLKICEKVYEKKSPWEKTVYKPVTEQIKQETKAPEALPVQKRK